MHGSSRHAARDGKPRLRRVIRSLAKRKLGRIVFPSMGAQTTIDVATWLLSTSAPLGGMSHTDDDSVSLDDSVGCATAQHASAASQKDSGYNTPVASFMARNAISIVGLPWLGQDRTSLRALPAVQALGPPVRCLDAFNPMIGAFISVPPADPPATVGERVMEELLRPVAALARIGVRAASTTVDLAVSTGERIVKGALNAAGRHVLGLNDGPGDLAGRLVVGDAVDDFVHMHRWPILLAGMCSMSFAAWVTWRVARWCQMSLPALLHLTPPARGSIVRTSREMWQDYDQRELVAYQNGEAEEPTPKLFSSERWQQRPANLREFLLSKLSALFPRSVWRPVDTVVDDSASLVRHLRMKAFSQDRNKTCAVALRAHAEQWLEKHDLRDHPLAYDWTMEAVRIAMLPDAAEASIAHDAFIRGVDFGPTLPLYPLQ